MGNEEKSDSFVAPWDPRKHIGAIFGDDLKRMRQAVVVTEPGDPCGHICFPYPVGREEWVHAVDGNELAKYLIY
jgi:hypothetical protein